MEKQVLSHARDLNMTGSFTPHFTRQQDLIALEQARAAGNAEEFSQIQRARDVYALGIKMLCLFNPSFRDEVNETPASARDDNWWSFMKEHLKDVSSRVPILLKNSGLSPQQITRLANMVSTSWQERPTASEVMSVFSLDREAV